MRILFVTEEPIDFSGTMIRGGQIHVRNVVQGLRDRGHEVHLVDWNSDPTEPFQHSVSPRTRFVDGPLRTLQKVVSVGRDIEPDAIISKTRKVYLPGLIAARRLGVPHIVHVGSGVDPLGDGIVERLDSSSKSARLRAPHDGYFVVCDALRSELTRRGVASERVFNVKNAVDTSQFTADPDVELPATARRKLDDVDGPVLGFVGTVARQKGVLDLVDAIRRVDFDPTILIAGDGPELIRVADRLGERGILLGSVPYEQMPAVYASLDALVLPSYSEGLPRVVLEAGAAGVPVIATRVGGIPEVIENGKTGLLCPPRDPVALSEAIDTLFSEYDPESVGATFRAVVGSEFSWEQQFDRYESFVTEIRDTH